MGLILIGISIVLILLNAIFFKKGFLYVLSGIILVIGILFLIVSGGGIGPDGSGSGTGTQTPSAEVTEPTADAKETKQIVIEIYTDKITVDGTECADENSVLEAVKSAYTDTSEIVVVDNYADSKAYEKVTEVLTDHNYSYIEKKAE